VLVEEGRTVGMTQNAHKVEPLVSVVTPFYNTAAYLAECIESVLRQTYRNWEYVLLNNCSTDNGLEIAQHYAQQEPRIRVYNNSAFLSQVQNYNEALRYISGESKYCKVVQADDWIFPECLTRMVEVAENNPSVGIVGAYALYGQKVYLDGLPYPSTKMSGCDVCRAYFRDGLYVFGTPTSLLIRSDIMHCRDPFYDETSPVEDAEVCFDILREHDFGFLHQVLTYTRRDNTSLMTSINTYDPATLLEFRTVRKFGRDYLDDEEYQRCARRIEMKYFMLLGESTIRCRERAFWAFHEQGMQTVGAKFTGTKRLKYASLAFLTLALNLQDTLERVSRHFRRKRHG
jgi:glycosyltransferase involved in cell wall biosynthesis